MRRSRVYVWPVGETILENLQNRRNRPVADYRRVVTKELRDAGLHGELKWSQKAGCGCGCSPGFVYEAPIYVDERPCDIHVHVRAK